MSRGGLGGWVGVLGLLLGAASCDPAELLVQMPEGGLRPVGLRLSLSPRGGASASQAAAWRAADRVWLHLGNEQTTVLDSVFPFDSQAEELALQVQVQVPEGEELTLTVEMRSGVGVVMRAVQPADLAAAVTVPMDVRVSSTAASVAAGQNATCAIAADMRAYCWGANYTGAIGDPGVPWVGTTTPNPVAGGQTFSTVSLGGGTACALDSTGQAYCWGSNKRGQVGNGTTVSAWPFAVTAPVAVSGGHSFAAISAGGGWNEDSGHTCAVTRAGEGYCWGNNSFGELGLGTTAPMSPLPASIAGGRSYRAISAGWEFTCAVTVENEGYCWGRNSWGQLGNGTTTASTQPVPVSGGHHFLSIDAGNDFACGIVLDGGLYCWGINSSQQLGLGVASPHSDVPVRVADGQKFRSVSIGQDYACALSWDGDAYCWGGNWQGRLGRGDLDGNDVPTPVAGGGKWLTLSAGSVHACGIRENGVAACWGWTDAGARGTGVVGFTAASTPIIGAANYVSVSAGVEHACALNASGEAYCWGANYDGRLGLGVGGGSTSSAAPTAVLGGHRFVELQAGLVHTCGIRLDGAAFCWGGGYEGSLGNDAVQPRGSSVPVPVDGSLQFVQLATGAAHSCGIASGGETYCWGRNAHGQLGDGTTSNRRVPTRVSGGLQFAEIRAAGNHSCGLTSTGAAYCWGANATGQLGDGTVTQSPSPVAVLGGLFFQDLDLSGQMDFSDGASCGVTSAGDLYCWGNQGGCLIATGNCDPIPLSSPVQVGAGRQYRMISLGLWFGCAMGVDDQRYCWGGNNHEQAGIPHLNQLHGSTFSDPGIGVPTASPSAATFASISAGSDFGCGVAVVGGVHCWGGYGVGQLGGGQWNFAASPEAVLGGLLFN